MIIVIISFLCLCAASSQLDDMTAVLPVILSLEFMYIEHFKHLRIKLCVCVCVCVCREREREREREQESLI